MRLRGPCEGLNPVAGYRDGGGSGWQPASTARPRWICAGAGRVQGCRGGFWKCPVESNLYTYTLSNNIENQVLGNAAVEGYGNSLANRITGSSANFMVSGAGDDTYVINREGKTDVIRDTDSTAGNTDEVRFGAGVAANQLWFRHVGNNLEVSIIGTSDTVTVRNWYLGYQSHVEQFRSSDGKLLLDSAVDNLVNAMASFVPPAAGQTTLPSNYQANLSIVIAANWY